MTPLIARHVVRLMFNPGYHSYSRNFHHFKKSSHLTFPSRALAYTLAGGWSSLPANRDTSRGVQMTTTNWKVFVHALLIFVLGAVSFAARAETGLAAVYSHRLDGHKTASGKSTRQAG